ncbi:polysaccharide deacetylase family protein [Micrococcus lacusdianchii]|uniref:polysaccharide deacetylase family protein n=1 Tax=Micrococcus lacusdianchii TaxID=2915940 RepID=UPI0020047C8D
MSPSRRHVLFGGSALSLTALLAACAPGREGAPSSSAAPDGSTAGTPAPASSSPAGPPPAGPPTPWADVTRVPHLFFHSLVVDTDRAFHAHGKADGYLDYMVTLEEFQRILPQLWTNGYVLVSPHELYEVGADDVVRPRELMVPEGRTPLILSLDDCSYYEYMEGDGFASRLVVADDGRVRTEYTDAAGNTEIGAHDMVPVLDDFVAAHPDFTLTGAKGVLGLTGYNGVLGYRSSPSQYANSPTLQEDIAAARRVKEVMAADGWEFASHSWSHRSLGAMDLAELKEDCEMWIADVQPVLGETDMLIYPFGADIAGTETYSGPKYEYLRSIGFRSFFLVDGSAKAWGQLEPGYYRGSRINVDGISLAAALDGSRPVLDEFIDSSSVVDDARPETIHSPSYVPPGKRPSPSASASPSA